MGQLEREVARSHAVVMIEAAMKADAEHLNIVLVPLDQPFGRTQ